MLGRNGQEQDSWPFLTVGEIVGSACLDWLVSALGSSNTPSYSPITYRPVQPITIPIDLG